MRPVLIAIVCVLAATLAYGIMVAPSPPRSAQAVAPQQKGKSQASEDYKSDPCYPPDKGFAGWRNCIKIGPARAMRGIWYSAFAQDFFVEGATTAPTELGLDPPELTTALDIDRKIALRRSGQRNGAWCIRAFAVEFTGRLPAEDIGAYDLRPEKLVLVDHLSTVRFLHDVKLRGVPANEQDCAKTPNPMAAMED